MRYFIIASIITILFSACKTKQVAQKPVIEKPDTPPNVAIVLDWKSAYENCKTNNLVFDTYSASGKLIAKIPNQDELELSYRLNIQNDSMIWLKVTKFGLEGMRALITPKKIQVIDNLNSKAYVMDFAKIGQFIGMSVDFHTLQDLLVGNIPTLNNDSIQFKEEKDKYLLSFTDSGRNFLYEIGKQETKLAAIHTDKPNDTQKASMFFSAFQPVGQNKAPYVANVNFTAKQSGEFELKHTRVELNVSDLQFGFSIPDGFEIIEQ